MSEPKKFFISLDNTLQKGISLVSVSAAIFYFYCGFGGHVTRFQLIAPLVCFSLVVVFLRNTKSRLKVWKRFFDYFLAACSILVCIYLLATESQTYSLDVTLPSGFWLFVSLFFIFLVLEGTRRAVGSIMPALAGIFLIYNYIAQYLGGPLRTAPISVARIVDIQVYTFQGIWGIPISVCASIIVFFLVFAAMLRECGANDVFNDLAASLFGTMRGGPAKMAVVASGFFGMISGTSLANVQTTGVFTIPLMKKTGYSAAMAGAIESAASSGGQIMPPMMGATAFVMAAFLNVPYWTIVKIAILPGVLYFLSILTVVHFEAAKMGLKGLNRSELPSPRKAIVKSWIVVVPMAILIYFLGVVHSSATKSILMTTISLVVISMFDSRSRLSFRKLWRAFDQGMRSMASISLACLSAGIIIGVVFLTNFGIVLSSSLISLSHGNILLLLILAMLASLVLGMGMTTTACYLILAILVAPAMLRVGVPLMAAHLFILYFGTLSSLTPPVCLTAYAAAPLADAPPMKIGWLSLRITILAFIIPYLFCFSPSLLLHGSVADILITTISALIGVVGFGAGLQGYLYRSVNMIQRLLLVLGGIAMIIPGVRSDLLGFVLITIVSFYQALRERRIRERMKNKAVGEYTADCQSDV